MAMSNAGGTMDSLKAALLPGKLEKATVFLLDATTGKSTKTLKVQFNPSQYSISRGNNMKEKPGVGQDGNINQVQSVSGGLATLQVNLIFDTISAVDTTDIRTGLPDPMAAMASIATAVEKVADAVMSKALSEAAGACDEFVSMIKFDPEQHSPSLLYFVWGALKFKGFVQSCQVNYTMFNNSGTPVKAQVSLTLLGEEAHVLSDQDAVPFESPDRTKERMLSVGDQMWMMANQEYDDPGKWKIIAEANGVLNPRNMGQSVALKVPSIR